MGKVDDIINEFYEGKPTKVQQKRIRYPKINLQPYFIEALEKQVRELKKEGMPEKTILQRMQKALEFHI